MRPLFILAGLVFTGAAMAQLDAVQRNGVDSLIALAIRNHPEIAAKRAERAAAQSEISAARAQYWPTPSIQALQDRGSTTTVLQLQQPLWAGGGLDAGLAAARSRESAAGWAVDEAQEDLALRVISAWAAWLQARGRAEALAEGMALLGVYAESAKRRIEGGVSAEVDRELVESRLAQFGGDLAAARSSERAALSRLAQLTGQALRPEDLVDAPIEVDDLPADPLVAQALARPLMLKLDVGLAAARARESAAGWAVDEAQDDLAQRVVAAWSTWLQARLHSDALAKGIALLNVYAERAKRRVQGGASAQVDRELVESRLAQFGGDLAAARSSELAARSRLAQLTGQALRAKDLVDAPNKVSNLPALDVLIERALIRSPTLKRIEAEIEAAGHETDRKRAALWPTLNLLAQHQRGEAQLGANTNDTRVVLALGYTPGSGLSSVANIKAAEARRQGLRASLDAACRALIDRITTDYEEYRSSLSRKRDAERTIKASSLVLASYDRLFVAGKRSWLDVINAARELIQARLLLADAKAARIAARTRLRLYAGDLPWQQAGDTP